MTDYKVPITVIINMYKGQATVSRMIDCVLNQTFTDFELILVDDGSPDRCGEIAEEYARKDSRVRVLHKPNGGLADSRNHALDIAQGEYTIQFDQDDWLELNCLEEMFAAAKNADADMLICDIYRNDQYCQKYVKQKPTALDHWSVLEDLITGRIFGYCWNKMIRLDAYKKTGAKFPIEFYGCEDQYGMCQLLKHDLQVAYLPKAFCHYYYVQGSLSHHYDEKTFENDLLVREMFSSFLKDTPLGELAYSCKSSAIFTRAYLFGQSQYSSSEFSSKFLDFYPYVKASGIEKVLYAMANKGKYRFSRVLFSILFGIKQIFKKFSRQDA